MPNLDVERVVVYGKGRRWSSLAILIVNERLKDSEGKDSLSIEDKKMMKLVEGQCRVERKVSRGNRILNLGTKSAAKTQP